MGSLKELFKRYIGSYRAILGRIGMWIWDALYWLSFFSRLWSWRTVIFQLSGFDCGWVAVWAPLYRVRAGLAL